MANLQIDKGIESALQTVRFARSIGKSPHEAVGWLVAFWGQCWDQFSSGVIPISSEQDRLDLEGMLRWPGDPGVLALALHHEGYILAGGVVAGWEKRYGPYFRDLERRRKYNRERNQRLRGSDSDGQVGGLSKNDVAPDVAPMLPLYSGPRRTETNGDEMRRDEINDVDARATPLLVIDGKATAAREIVVSLFSTALSRKEAEKQAVRLIAEAGHARAQRAATAIAPHMRKANRPGAFLQAWLDRKGWESEEPWVSADGVPVHERPPDPIGPSRKDRQAQSTRDQLAAENVQAAENRKKIADLARSIGKGGRP